MVAHAHFRVTGPATAGNTVPAEVLVRTIQGVQQSVWLLAAAAESRIVRSRFKPDQAFKQRFTLQLSVPRDGSYDLPLQLVDARPQISISNIGPNPLLADLLDIWSAIASDNLPLVRSLVGDEGYFLRLMQEFHRLLPKRGENWGLSFGAAGKADVDLGVRHRAVVERWLESPNEQRETAVIGELLRIDFAQKRLWVCYPPTKREIECTYCDEVEDTIVEARRGLFQVIGHFVLDANGHPKQLTDVRSIEPVDLSPVQLSEAELDGEILVIEPPIVLTPRLDEDEQQYFVASVNEFGLTLGGSTRDALLQDWAEQMHFIWREYAMVSENELTRDAQELRNRLLERVQARQG